MPVAFFQDVTPWSLDYIGATPPQPAVAHAPAPESAASPANVQSQVDRRGVQRISGRLEPTGGGDGPRQRAGAHMPCFASLYV